MAATPSSSDSAPDSATIARVKDLLRQDLRLGPDAEIEDDMPLLGGNFDLDSLDVLMLVTSAEKAFGIRIPNEAVGREAFESVTTLARFIENQLGADQDV